MKHSVVLRFFYCGKGDTILLQASVTPGKSDEWALVDCHLTKKSGSHWRVRDFIAREGIRRLKFVCLTHPDRDHYFGMCSLLRDCFYDDKKDELRVDEFWDSGVEFTMLSAIAEYLGTKAIKAELDELYEGFLTKLILADKLEYQEMTRGTVAATSFGDFELLSISPRCSRVARFNEQGAESVLGATRADVESAREESNDLSVVLVLMHRTLPVNIVLGGDATTRTWVEALHVWPKLAKLLSRSKSHFAGVKISHHGAKSSHHPDLYLKHCRKRQTVAILTVGPNDANHPHKDVIALLKRRRIRTYLTCWPAGGSTPAKSTLPLPGSRATPPVGRDPGLHGYAWADVEVAVRPNGRLSAKPNRARLF